MTAKAFFFLIATYSFFFLTLNDIFSFNSTQISQIIELGRIETTYARAHSVKRLVDKVITLGKKGSFRSFQTCQKYVWKRSHAVKVFTDFAERYKFRPGGYTRLVRTRRRRGDNALMCYIELVDRVGELRAPRAVSYEYAVAKGLAPAPHPALPNETAEDKIKLANAAPSTSYNASHKSGQLHWHFRDHWIQNTLYHDFKRDKIRPSPVPVFEAEKVVRAEEKSETV